jgi:hypothetical protein
MMMMMIEPTSSNKLTYTILRQLKSHPSFKKEKENFVKFIKEGAKIRINKELNYFLVYDLDRKRWSIQGELKANYNHVTVMVGIIPSIKDIEKEVKIEEYNFDNPQINKYSIYD